MRPLFLLTVFLLSVSQSLTQACSMYKITTADGSVVGCNEDAWRLTPRIWFENKGLAGQYGAVFTGSRYDGKNGFAPQSGMNVHGLVYSRLAAPNPGKPANFVPAKPIDHPTLFLKEVLHSCASVAEVKTLFQKYDHSLFNQDVLIYIDSTGNYLIVEPYRLIEGNESKYVLSNFCPSVTDEASARALARYRNGRDFLKTHKTLSPDFYRQLSDTMHVCREKIGDGTLQTSIWDHKKGTVTLYFYHNYQYPVVFNVLSELLKGDHMMEVDKLFPENEEFHKLANFQVPWTNTALLLFLVFSGVLTGLFAVYNLYRMLLRNRSRMLYRTIAVAGGMLMLYFCYLLCTNASLFYFDFPYVVKGNILQSLMSYFPFLLPLLLLMAIYYLLRVSEMSRFEYAAIASCVLIGVVNMGMYLYWGFYGVNLMLG